LPPRPPGTAGHRNRLRYVEIVDGVVYIDLSVELHTVDRFGGSEPLVLVRVPGCIRLPVPTSSAGGTNRARPGPYEIDGDSTEALRRSTVSLLLRVRDTEEDVRVPTDTRIDASTSGGPATMGPFTVRLSATATFDLQPMTSGSSPVAWHVFTVVNAFGAMSVAPVGTQRDKVMANRVGTPSDLPDGRRARATVTDHGPQLVLEVSGHRIPGR
jgi:hypothetical protein